MSNARSHGQSGHHSRTPEYSVWGAMIQRCTNPNNPNFTNYGGRGIQPCMAWRSFETFFRDMGPRPTSTHTLERRDRDGGYSPDNCLWATRIAQNNNTRRNRFVTFNDKTLTVAEWARELGINKFTLAKRVDRWPIDEALRPGPPSKRHRK